MSVNLAGRDTASGGTVLHLDILELIAYFSPRETLRQGLSLVSRDALQVSRPYLVEMIELDMRRMLEYHTLKCDAAEATRKKRASEGPHAHEVAFSLPLHRTRVLKLMVVGMGYEEIAALSHLMRVSEMRPTELVVRANLRVNVEIRAYTYAHLVLPMQEAFAGVDRLYVSSTDMEWAVDMLFWIALCPRTTVVVTGGVGAGRRLIRNKAIETLFNYHEPENSVFRSITLATGVDSPNTLAQVILEDRLDLFSPRPTDLASGPLATCSFPAAVLIVQEDFPERMLHTLKFWRYRGMSFHLTHIKLEVVHWSKLNGVVLLHHFMLACQTTLQDIFIGNMLLKGEWQSWSEL